MNEREQTCIDKREKTIRPHTDINNSRVSQQPGDYTVLHNSKLTSEISDSKNNVATSATWRLISKKLQTPTTFNFSVTIVT